MRPQALRRLLSIALSILTTIHLGLPAAEADHAVASGFSGLILSAYSHDDLCLIGSVLVAIPVIVMLRHRKALDLAQRQTPREP